ncbi:hypothetical protein [Paenibacillus sp. 7523-1]|uniref:hypothetical protein n=1 Tax=Paenibacillus sp. 7523-1 TaxID=2022550 RepID=UPI000BA4EFE2|nr:hypothetical protein [Paenibacillus sp. 7523-1]PAD30040.1 hypothetical protein CHH60_18070 [Paenibacillus sp. 7523-1]
MPERLYKPICKDLIEREKKCHFCAKNMTSLKAYKLKHKETGEIVCAGPSCTEKNIDQGIKLSAIPDLTKYTQPLGGNGGGGGGGNSEKPIIRAEEDKRKAMEYLELREKKFEKYHSVSYSVLKNYYNKSQNEELNEREIRHILNIENKTDERYKLANLQRCYNYLFWIDVALDKLEEHNDFLESIKTYIIRNFKITSKQKDAVNNWMKNIKGVPQIK